MRETFPGPITDVSTQGTASAEALVRTKPMELV